MRVLNTSRCFMAVLERYEWVPWIGYFLGNTFRKCISITFDVTAPFPGTVRKISARQFRYVLICLYSIRGQKMSCMPFDFFSQAVSGAGPNGRGWLKALGLSTKRIVPQLANKQTYQLLFHDLAFCSV